MNYKGKKHLINKRNEKSRKKQIKKSKNTKTSNILYLTEKKLWVKLKQKYNCDKKKYESFLVDYLLNNVNCHIVSVFKEKMLSDYVDEFMHRKYDKKESEERMPKYYNYYKNYLYFFCKPTFKDMKFNDIIQNNGEKKAELYYKRNYLKAKSFDDMKDCGFEKSDSVSSSDSQKSSNDEKDSNIFNEKLKEKLENDSVLTTISNGINKTMNLDINNEKLEVFCENKYDISNDTTVANFINDYGKEIEKNKSKKNNIKSYKTIKNRINNKKKLFNKQYIKKSNEKNRKKEKKVNFLKIYFSNIKQNKKIDFIKNKKELQFFYKEYNKIENELNDIIRNYKNNLKNKYNRKTTTTTVSSTPHYNYSNKYDIKSRNKKKILFNKTSIQTVTNVYTTQNRNNNNKSKTIYKIKDNKKNNDNKRYNSNSTSAIKIKLKKKIKYLNDGICETYYNKSHKKVNNLSIKTEKTCKTNNKNNISLNTDLANGKNKKEKNFINSTNNCHKVIRTIKINKNNKLFQKNKNNLTKDRNKNNITNEFTNININNINISNINIKNRNNNSSKEKMAQKTKMNKTKIYKKSRNYGSCSSLNSTNNQYNKKNKSIYYNSMSNINYYINNTHHNIIIKTQNNLNKNKINKKRYKKKGSNLTYISFPLMNNNKIISPYNRIYNKNKKTNNYSKSVSNIFNSNTKKLKYKNNSKSINKTELINNSSNKNNKYRKTIMSYITKSDTTLSQYKNKIK